MVVLWISNAGEPPNDTGGSDEGVVEIMVSKSSTMILVSLTVVFKPSTSLLVTLMLSFEKMEQSCGRNSTLCCARRPFGLTQL